MRGGNAPLLHIALGDFLEFVERRYQMSTGFGGAPLFGDPPLANGCLSQGFVARVGIHLPHEFQDATDDHLVGHLVGFWLLTAY